MFLSSTNLTRSPLAIDSDLHNGLFMRLISSTALHIRTPTVSTTIQSTCQERNTAASSVWECRPKCRDPGTYILRVYSTLFLRYESSHPAMNSGCPRDQGVINSKTNHTRQKLLVRILLYISEIIRTHVANYRRGGISKIRYERPCSS